MRIFVPRSNTFSDASDAIIAPIMAIILTVIMAVMLLAVDVRAAIDTKQRLQYASDIAALDSARLLYDHFIAGTVADITDTVLTERARLMVQQQVRGQIDDPITLSVTQDLKGGVYTVTVAYRVLMSKIAGETTYYVSGESVANVQVEVPIFTELHVLLDFSASMSMGANEADQTALWQTQNCAFACHTHNIDAARDADIVLRQDKLIDTLNQIVDAYRDAVYIAPETHRLPPDTVQFTFWVFSGRDTTSRFSSNTNITSLRADIAELAERYPGGNTDIIQALFSIIATTTFESDNYTGWLQNDGGSADTRKPAFIIITDGLSNEGHRLTNRHADVGLPKFEEENVYADVCNVLKTTFGLQLGIIHIPHQPYAVTMHNVFGSRSPNGGSDDSVPYFNQTMVGWHGHFVDHVVRPFQGVRRHFGDCASEGLYLQTTAPDAIAAAFEAYFDSLRTQTAPNPYLVN